MTERSRLGGDNCRTERIWARVAGFLFLWLIGTGVAGMLIVSRVAGSGTFAEAAARVAASQRLYRVGLALELIETLSALLLAFALYAALRRVDGLLAQLAMLWRFAESFVGMAGMIFGYAKLSAYVSPQLGAAAPEQAQGLLAVLRQAGSASYNIGALCFSIGSVLFFWLFLKSEYIPRVLSLFGVFASVTITFVCFGALIFPEHSATLQYGWAPMAIAEVATGLWLLFGVKIPRAASGV